MLRPRGAETTRAPFGALGRYGRAINLVAIRWVRFITVILSIPENMRAGKAVGGLTLLLAGWYLVRERHRFRGPAWAYGRMDAPPATHPAGGPAVLESRGE